MGRDSGEKDFQELIQRIQNQRGGWKQGREAGVGVGENADNVIEQQQSNFKRKKTKQICSVQNT